MCLLRGCYHFVFKNRVRLHCFLDHLVRLIFFNFVPEDYYERNMFPLYFLYSLLSFDLHYSKKNNSLLPSFMKCWVPFSSSLPIRKFVGK